MGIEIERKFLVENDSWRTAVRSVTTMTQGYLNDLSMIENGRQRASVRIRIEGKQAFLNIKSRDLGYMRQEFDYEIPIDEANEFLSLCTGSLIDKRRYHIQHHDHLWEVDEFLGDNAGLIVAEIELTHTDEYFERPDWLGIEVTDQTRYYNLALADRPYSQWTQHERQPPNN
ncbi:MAG: CYTH domain-containing protein [Xanthomonadaceae bacterium]|jgi:adenylate cyclase|nr:CYTH domain-containing protein [Xanthomonadaceae bacterium]